MSLCCSCWFCVFVVVYFLLGVSKFREPNCVSPHPSSTTPPRPTPYSIFRSLLQAMTKWRLGRRKWREPGPGWIQTWGERTWRHSWPPAPLGHGLAPPPPPPWKRPVTGNAQKIYQNNIWHRSAVGKGWKRGGLGASVLRRART